MKRAFFLSLGIVICCTAPIAEAQSPAACEGGYRGTYTGDFNGEVTGNFSLGDFGFCSSPPIGGVGIAFHGAFAQFFFDDETRTLVSTAACVLDDLSLFDGGASFETGGSMDLNTCIVSGTWSFARPGVGTRSGTFTMNLVDPLERQRIRWTALNGDFNNSENWDPQEVPAAGQDAVFDQNEAYAVSFGSPASSGGFVVEQGAVTFLTGTYTATGGSQLAPSAIVGNSANTNTFLTLANHTLTTSFSTFAPGPDDRGGVIVKNDSTWIEQGRMVIGQGGAGSLEIQDTAAVTSMETQLGAEPSGGGTVEVTPQFPFKGAAAEWTTGSIAIGLRGQGTVNHRGGSVQSHSVSIGVEAGSDGTVTVGSAGNSAIWEFDGPMTVGGGGIGRLNIVEGGFVASTTTDIDFVHVGVTAGSSIGNLRVEGTSSTLDVPNSIVSAGGSSSGSGFITLKNGGLLKSRSTLIEQNGSLRVESAKLTFNTAFLVDNLGTVALNNGSLVAAVADAELRVSTGGLVTGSGSIRVAEPEIFGTVAPGVIISDPKGLTGLVEAIGTLTFGGNVHFDGATLEIEVGGHAEGSYDVIHATGAVNIQNSTVVFRFVDGFLPQTGDAVPFLVADADVTIANLVLVFEGVADGFQFEVTEENGMLVFEALNDAQPKPIPSADLNGDGQIDFIDLLIFTLQRSAEQ